MSFELDDSIRDEFLAEAAELVENLSGELVELERRPDDRQLLDSIFRAFHTIKGGAGFLNVTSLVDICHAAEEAFDALRKGHLIVDAEVMDAVLDALDQTSSMLAAVSSGETPKPAPTSLIDRLRKLAAGEAAGTGDTGSRAQPDAGPESSPEPEPVIEAVAGAEAGQSEDPAERDYETMLVEAGGQIPEAHFSDEEIEGLVEQLDSENVDPHGDPAQRAGDIGESRTEAAGGDDLITEDEFEDLLDQLEVQRQPEKTPSEAGTSQSDAGFAVADGPEGVAPARAAAPVESTIRVNVSRLDSVMNLVGELVLVRNRLTNLGAHLKDEELKKAVANLDLVTADLQSGVMQTRMQPIKKVFSRFPRLARDVARNLDKEIDLVMSGEKTDLDKNLVEALSDPLVHLVRNAMDHGIESPEVREAIGKPRTGTVRLGAEQEGDHIIISISDDGAGMDPETLRSKAVARGVITADQGSKMSDQECFDLIFQPGFSTRDQVSDISGRGVGMDVVKTRIASLNGNVEIDSRKNEGTTIRVKVPLTLAILPTLMVTLNRRTFAFPLSQVIEVFSLEAEKARDLAGRRVVVRRDRPLPVVSLRQIFGIRDTEHGNAERYVVVLQVGSTQIGFVTDDVIGQEEVVIKPLGKLLSSVSAFAGATITGDGNIALIFDVAGLTSTHQQAA